MVGIVAVSMGDNFIKNSRIKILKPHAHLHIIGRKSTEFQVNLMKDVGGVAETRSLGQPAEWMDRQMDGITHIWWDEGHFYSPPLPTPGDNDYEKKIPLTGKKKITFFSK